MRRWSSVCFVICGLCLLAAILLATGTIWSDFAQKVYIATLSTSGSAAVAVTLYFLKRWHDRVDEGTKVQITYQNDLLKAVIAHRDDMSERVGEVLKGNVREALLSHSRRLADYQTLIGDTEIKKFCFRLSIAYMRQSLNLGANDYTDEKATHDMAFQVLSLSHNAVVELRRYIAEGASIDYDQLDPQKLSASLQVLVETPIDDL